MPEEKVDSEGFVIDESGERVIDNDGNPILKTEAGAPTIPTTPTETLEELRAKLAELDKVRASLERERDGFKSDLFAERDRRRTAEEEVKRSKAVDPLAGMSKEEREEWWSSPPTRREIIEELDADRRETDRRILEAQRVNSERDAKRSHSDYDKVSKLAEELISSNPDLKASLEYARDYAEAKYAIGRTHPSYIEEIKQQTRREMTESLQKAGGRTQSLAGQTGRGQKSSDDVTLQDLSAMSPAQIAALPEATRERLLGGSAATEGE